jgi:rod shape-determining protein MreC
MERDPLNWYRSLMVDAGSEQGVAINAPVLGQQGDNLVAIGRVAEVRSNSSVMLLLTDELSYAAAYAANSSTDDVKSFEGLLQGQGSARLRLSYLSPDATVAKGDKVFTSPTSAIFAGDILIGTVVKVYPVDPFLNFQSVEVAPAADGSSLKEVMILKTRAALPKFAGTESEQTPETVSDAGESP